MSRQDRLKEYANPMHGPHGASSDKANLDYWSARATSNSHVAPRASNGPVKTPDTGRVEVRSHTRAAPRSEAEIDSRMAGRGDKNHVADGSGYMKSIRREA